MLAEIGNRNIWLYNMVLGVRRKGLDPAIPTLLDAARALNKLLNDPLPDAEVRAVTNSVSKVYISEDHQ